ncbi:MAG: tol-pal system-associated acyl-CoA thioesterase [Alphaproteobacteria bacterium]|nr:tol-pal system-associated acyl-CoA thioesterase [Alphaproteobacteria bacterium]MCW5743195.1 tol-pal system-associated acyl-CoA thioesterase [Alphaproteobacteria bacterium]
MTRAHVLPLRVYYEDTDAAGIVYHANYLRFMERGRTEFLRELGHDLAAMRSEIGINWAVKRLAIEYIAPGRLDEALQVVTTVEVLRGASVDLRQQVKRGDTMLTDSTLTLVCMNAAGRPVRLPSDARTALGERAITSRSGEVTPD